MPQIQLLEEKKEEEPTIQELKDKIRQNELRIEQILRAYGELQNKVGVIESFLMQEPVATDPAVGGMQ